MHLCLWQNAHAHTHNFPECLVNFWVRSYCQYQIFYFIHSNNTYKRAALALCCHCSAFLSPADSTGKMGKRFTYVEEVAFCSVLFCRETQEPNLQYEEILQQSTNHRLLLSSETCFLHNIFEIMESHSQAEYFKTNHGKWFLLSPQHAERTFHSSSIMLTKILTLGGWLEESCIGTSEKIFSLRVITQLWEMENKMMMVTMMIKISDIVAVYTTKVISSLVFFNNRENQQLHYFILPQCYSLCVVLHISPTESFWKASALDSLKHPCLFLIFRHHVANSHPSFGNSYFPSSSLYWSFLNHARLKHK